MRLETERLAMRPVETADLDAIASFMSDPEVCRYLGDGKPRTRDRVARSVAFARRMWAERGFGPFAIERKGLSGGAGTENAFVGVCLLLPIARTGTDPADFDARGPEIELGYWLARGSWGHGYATEAARAVLAWAVTGDGPCPERVIAVTNPANEASKRVLEKVGMRLVGETDAYYDAVTTLYETGL